MIKFQTTKWELDLSLYKITFTEKNDIFSKITTKSYSLPFNIKLTPDISEKFGLINVENISSYKSKINGFLLKGDSFFDAYISINQILQQTAEITIFYGKEILEVFDKTLSSLPFPVINTGGTLPNFAKNQITKQYPEATHQFVKIYRPGIREDDNYKFFERFVNNYVDNSGSYEFPANSTEVIGGETVSVNRNVMQAQPYLLTILKQIFAYHNLQLRGPFVNDPFVKRIVYVPQNYFENFAVAQYDTYSFSEYSYQELVNDNIVSVYKKSHTPSSVGSYSLEFVINMSNVVAQYFELKIEQNGVVLFSAISENNEVVIDDSLDIVIDTVNIYQNIDVILKITPSSIAITDFNRFTYQFAEGRVNEFPAIYTLAEFMPKMKVRDFINNIKKWLNVKFDYSDNAVYVSYLDDYLDTIIYEDKSHLEVPKLDRVLNKTKLFKLQYPDDSTVLCDKSGQVYSEVNFNDNEIKNINISCLPLKIKSNYDKTTVEFPKEESELMFCLYDGVIGNDNHAAPLVNGSNLTLQHIYNNNFKKWLSFRANSEENKDVFYMSTYELFDIKKGIFKYNKKHLIKSIVKTTQSNKRYKVTIKTETL